MSQAQPPRFSIIVPHYDGAISDERFMRGYSSLVNQIGAPHYEILIYHDGPTSRPIRLDTPVIETPQRYNDWGHSLRDLGIREAKGEYIIHFNPDNVLYPFALQEIHKELLRQRPTIQNVKDNNEIVIFPILMRGMQNNGHTMWREVGNEENVWLIFSGFPTEKYYIDCLQLVMKRDTWLAEGGWSDKSEEADGNMYPYFVRKYGAKYIGRILGEHW
jgi:hypothetical protein